jgi:hypothetical protein
MASPFLVGNSLLGFKVFFYFGGYHDPELEALCKRKGIKKDEYSEKVAKTLKGYNIRDENVGSCIVWLPKTPVTIKDLSILVHEISHATEHIFEYFSYEGEELRCTIIEYLVCQSMARIRRSWTGGPLWIK